MNKNKGLSIQLATVALAAGLATSTGLAADVDWGVGAQTITGDTDVSTAGTLVDAFALGNSSVSATTVNGVTFQPFLFPDFSYSNPNTSVSGNYNFTEDSGVVYAYSGLGTGAGAYSSLSPAYQGLLANGGGSSFLDTLSLTISGLTVGNTYQFQWWDNNSSLSTSFNGYPLNTVATAGNAITLAENDTTEGSVGQFAIGTFTADDVTQVIAFTGSTEIRSNDPMLNAFQLRDVTVVPEPSTLALMGIGLAFLGTTWRFRRGNKTTV
jgi:hypothetical protein